MAELSKLKALWVKKESTFSTDPDTDGSDYAVVPAEGVEWAPTHAAIQRDVVRSGLGLSIASQAGQKGGSLKFKVPIIGANTVGADGVAAAWPTWLKDIIEGCGFSVIANTGTTVSGGSSSTTSVDVVSAAGITAGTLVMISGEVRLVTAVNTAATPDNITVTPALSSSPSNATVVYGGICATFLQNSTNTPATVAFVVKSDTQEETLLGCAGKMSVDSFDAGGRPMLAFEFMVDSWSDTSNKSSVPTTFSQPTNLLAMGSPFWWGSTSTKTAIASLGFDPGATVSEQLATSGTQGRMGYVVTGEEVKLTVKPYRSQSTYRSDYSTPNLRTALAQIGTTSGGAFAIAIQQAQIMELPSNEDVGGIAANQLVLRARAPTVSIPGFAFGSF